MIIFGFGEEFFDIFVLDGRDEVVDHLDFFGDDIESDNFVVLAQKSGEREPDVAGAGDGDFHVCDSLLV